MEEESYGSDRVDEELDEMIERWNLEEVKGRALPMSLYVGGGWE